MSAPPPRAAQRSDLPALVHIYNHYVRSTWVTFDTREFSVEERLPWFEGFAAEGPHRLLVSEQRGRIVGYASSRPFAAKPAYASSVETTIYLDPASVGRGLGEPLYAALLEVLRAESGVHRAYGGIALPNRGSISLHERLGFRRAGTYREVGYKLGGYRDVSWYEKDVSG